MAKISDFKLLLTQNRENIWYLVTNICIERTTSFQWKDHFFRLCSIQMNSESFSQNKLDYWFRDCYLFLETRFNVEF